MTIFGRLLPCLRLAVDRYKIGIVHMMTPFSHLSDREKEVNQGTKVTDTPTWVTDLAVLMIKGDRRVLISNNLSLCMTMNPLK